MYDSPGQNFEGRPSLKNTFNDREGTADASDPRVEGESPSKRRQPEEFSRPVGGSPPQRQPTLPAPPMNDHGTVLLHQDQMTIAMRVLNMSDQEREACLASTTQKNEKLVT